MAARGYEFYLRVVKVERVRDTFSTLNIKPDCTSLKCISWFSID